MVLVDVQNGEISSLVREWKTASPPKVLAAYMPWFGDKNHIDVGYSSHDLDVLRRQIDEAASMGIAGFVVDWNGPRRAYTDRSFALMEQVASEKQFQVALLYNESGDGDQSTDDTISDLDFAYKNYFGPEARYRDAYITFNNRPVIFIFPKSGKTDWDRVRQHISNWAAPPLLLYKDDSSHYANAFDGFYVWVHPGNKGWASDGSDWGKQHLEDFYKRMKDKYPGKITVAGAWPGFDDTRAHWGLNRHMDTRCGKTLEETMHMAQEFSGPNPFPFLLVQTWNDYEEGTEIERRALKACGKG
jgi:hypothetical protein